MCLLLALDYRLPTAGSLPYVFRSNSVHSPLKSAFLLAFRVWPSNKINSLRTSKQMLHVSVSNGGVRGGHECGAWALETLLLQCWRRPPPDLLAIFGTPNL